MEVSYQRFREDMEILALNPYDSAADIDAFQKEHSLTMPMGSCSQELAYALGVNGYNSRVDTHWNEPAEFTNYWYKRDARYFNDFNENMVVFYVA